MESTEGEVKRRSWKRSRDDLDASSSLKGSDANITTSGNPTHKEELNKEDRPSTRSSKRRRLEPITLSSPKKAEPTLTLTLSPDIVTLSSNNVNQTSNNVTPNASVVADNVSNVNPTPHSPLKEGFKLEGSLNFDESSFGLNAPVSPRYPTFTRLGFRV